MDENDDFSWALEQILWSFVTNKVDGNLDISNLNRTQKVLFLVLCRTVFIQKEIKDSGIHILLWERQKERKLLCEAENQQKEICTEAESHEGMVICQQ